jgi:hypothetical protein
MKLLTYKAIDVMKKSKDTLTSQITTAEKTALISCLAQTGCTHISISIPADDNSVWVAAGNTPSSRTAEAEVMDWCDVIHAQLGLDGTPLKVIHRPAFGGIENIFGVAYDQGTAIGTAASSATDVNTTWCGRYYRYLYNHVGTHVLSGDIFAPMPEGTTHAFDGHWFTTQSPYMNMFTELHTITDTYATAKGVSLVFMSHNNFSEVATGYISTIFANQSMAGADYYGQRQGSLFVRPEDYVYDWQQLYLGKDSSNGGANNAGGVNQFWGEWGDLSSAMPSGKFSHLESHLHFLIQFYKAVRDGLVTPNGHMVGFNYWGGWENQDTAICIKTGSGSSSVYTLNAMGKILAAFYTNVGGMVRVPVCTSGTTDGVGGRTFTF